MKHYSSEELRAFVQNKISLRELSSAINYSATTLSLWLRGLYPNDATQLEAALARWVHAQGLSVRDQRKFSYIMDLLHHAEDKQAIIDTIVQLSRSTEKK